MFRGLRKTPLTTAFVRTYVKVAGENIGAAEVVCPYSTGDAAIIEKVVGQGRCILFTTTCDTDWTNLPQKPVFLPLMHETVSHLLRGIDPVRNLRVAEPYHRILRPPEYGARFRLTRLSHPLYSNLDGFWTPPGREPQVLFGSSVGERFVLAFSGTSESGVYQVERTDTQTPVDMFCVRVPSDESDLSRISPEAIRRALPEFEFRYQSDELSSSPDAHKTDGPKEIWKALLWLVLALICLESYMAHRFSR
jgi:hypothetical protein